MKFKDHIKSRLEVLQDQTNLAINGMEKNSITSEKIFEILKSSAKILEEISGFLKREL